MEDSAVGSFLGWQRRFNGLLSPVGRSDILLSPLLPQTQWSGFRGTDRAYEDKRGGQSPRLTAVAPQPELDDLLPSPVPLWDRPPSHMYYRNDLKPSQEIFEPLDTATVAHPHVFKNKQMKNWARDSASGLTPTLRLAQLLRGLLGRAHAQSLAHRAGKRAHLSLLSCFRLCPD